MQGMTLMGYSCRLGKLWFGKKFVLVVALKSLLMHAVSLFSCAVTS